MDQGKRRALLSLMAVATSLSLGIGSVAAQDDDETMESAAPDTSAAPMASSAPMAPLPSFDPAALGPGLHVVGAWSRESPMMELAGAAFMVIVNNTETDDALVGASSPAATTVEIHQTTQAEDGTMTMAPVEEVPIPAGGIAELKPGSYHVMLIDLVAPLVVDEQIEVSLEFATAEPQTVMVPVQALGPMVAPMDDDVDAEGMEAQESEGPDDEE